MIDLDSTPARYRGTIEVYADEVYSRATAKLVYPAEELT